MLLTLRLSHGETQASRAELSLRQWAFLDQTTDGTRFTVADYHQRFASGVSERQARQDLLELVKTGYLTRIGSGRSTFYVRTGRQAS